jgi:hypothetical protein
VVGDRDAEQQRALRRRRALDRAGACSRLARGDLRDFRTAFAHTLRRVDRLQPALLVICLVSTIGFALSAAGTARTLAELAVAGFLIILVGSAAWLIPIQRRLVASGAERPPELERLRAEWLRGHLIRTFAALASLTLAVLAAAS